MRTNLWPTVARKATALRGAQEGRAHQQSIYVVSASSLRRFFQWRGADQASTTSVRFGGTQPGKVCIVGD